MKKLIANYKIRNRLSFALVGLLMRTFTHLGAVVGYEGFAEFMGFS